MVDSIAGNAADAGAGGHERAALPQRPNKSDYPAAYTVERVPQPDTARDDSGTVGDRWQLHRTGDLRFVRPHRRPTGREPPRLGPDPSRGANLCQTRRSPYPLDISEGPRPEHKILPRV